jgi:hypothetical protein
MKLSNRKPLFLALALTVAAPLAFAQSTTPQSTYPQSTPPTTTEPTTQSTTQDTTNAATSSQAATGTQNDATASTPSSDPKKVNWSDLDSNKNGTLSASEAASVSTLAKAFGEADANADGELTQDEYKAYLASNGKGMAPKSDSGG